MGNLSRTILHRAGSLINFAQARARIQPPLRLNPDPDQNKKDTSLIAVVKSGVYIPFRHAHLLSVISSEVPNTLSGSRSTGSTGCVISSDTLLITHF